MNFIDEKIKEMGDFVSVVSFDKGSDNYNRMKKLMLETYQAGVNGVDVIGEETIADAILDYAIKIAKS